MSILKSLTLIRGAQGSGKSTLARALINSIDFQNMTSHRRRASHRVVHLEADMFWYENDEGTYQFDMSRLGEAHEWCQEHANSAMACGFHDVIVSNTFIKRRDMKPYLDMAKRHGYTVQEIICRGEFENEHGVPQEIVERKRAELEL